MLIVMIGMNLALKSCFVGLKAIENRNMKRCIVFMLVLLMLNAYSQKDKKVMARLIKENMELAVKQYKYMAGLTPKDSMPRSFDAKTNRFIASNTDW